MDSLTLRIFHFPGRIFVLSLLRLTRVRCVKRAFLSLYSTNLRTRKAKSGTRVSREHAVDQRPSVVTRSARNRASGRQSCKRWHLCGQRWHAFVLRSQRDNKIVLSKKPHQRRCRSSKLFLRSSAAVQDRPECGSLFICTLNALSPRGKIQVDAGVVENPRRKKEGLGEITILAETRRAAIDTRLAKKFSAMSQTQPAVPLFISDGWRGARVN